MTETTTETKAPEPIPQYRVKLPDDPRIQECEDDLAQAKTMKELQAIARKWKVKGYKRFKAKNKDGLRDHIRSGVGILIGIDMFKERMSSLTEEELELMKTPSTAPVTSQRAELMGASSAPKEPEVLPSVPQPSAPSEVLPEEMYTAALRKFAEEHDRALFRVCDILPVFVKTLKDQTFDEGAWEAFTGGPRAGIALDILSGDMGIEDPFWTSQEASSTLEEVFATLNEVAPPGFYFGLDMSEMDRGFGFWMEKAVPLED